MRRNAPLLSELLYETIPLFLKNFFFRITNRKRGVFSRICSYLMYKNGHCDPPLLLKFRDFRSYTPDHLSDAPNSSELNVFVELMSSKNRTFSSELSPLNHSFTFVSSPVLSSFHISMWEISDSIEMNRSPFNS